MNISKLLILGLGVIITGTSVAQSSFELVLKEYPTAYIRTSLQSNTNQYILSIQANTETQFVRPYLIDFIDLNDQSGDYSILKKEFSIDPFNVFHMRKWGDSGYLIDAESVFPIEDTQPTDGSTYKRCVLEINKDFDLIDSACFISDGRVYGKAVVDEEDSYTFIHNMSTANRRIAFGKITKNSKTFHKVNNPGYLNFPTGLVQTLHNKDHWFVYTFGGVVEVDQDLNFIQNWGTKFGSMGTHGYLVRVNDEQIVAGGVQKILFNIQNNTYSHNQVIVRSLNSNYDSNWSDKLGIIPADRRDTYPFNYPAIDKCLDYKNGHIFFAGMNRIEGNFLYTSVPNSIFVTKYDQASGEEIWKYEMIKEEVFTILYGVQATSDGGCILYGFRRDPNEDGESYPYLLKLDANGQMTTGVIEEDPKRLQITIYGNPSETLRLNIDSKPEWSGHLHVIDMQGRILHVLEAGQGYQEWTLSNLATGVYSLILLDESAQIMSHQKWIKK